MRTSSVARGTEQADDLACAREVLASPNVDAKTGDEMIATSMAYRILADATVALHFAFVLFVVLGGAFVLRWPQVAWVHLPAAVWGAWIEFAGWVCPLTPLENWLRQRAGGAAYTASFVEHYLVPVLYPSALSRELQWVLGGFVLVVNAAVYLLVLRRRAGRSLATRTETRGAADPSSSNTGLGHTASNPDSESPR